MPQWPCPLIGPVLVNAPMLRLDSGQKKRNLWSNTLKYSLCYAHMRILKKKKDNTWKLPSKKNSALANTLKPKVRNNVGSPSVSQLREREGRNPSKRSGGPENLTVKSQGDTYGGSCKINCSTSSDKCIRANDGFFWPHGASIHQQKDNIPIKESHFWRRGGK